MPYENKHFDFNKKAVLAALRAAGAVKVVVTYSGSGDSGQIDDIEMHGPEASVGFPPAKVSLMNTVSMPPNEESAGKWRRADRQETVGLKSAVERVAYDMLDRHVGGWENNEGGQGSVEFLVEEGEVILHHDEFVIDTVSTTYKD